MSSCGDRGGSHSDDSVLGIILKNRGFIANYNFMQARYIVIHGNLFMAISRF